jgi:sugar lactone lactonase YvrE
MLGGAAAPWRPALAGPASGEAIRILAGEPQPAIAPGSTAMQPFGLAVYTNPGCAGSGSPALRRLPRLAPAIALSLCDTLYVADPVNYVVRALTFAGDAGGQSVLMGNGGRGTEGDNHDAVRAQLSGPYAVAPDPGTGEVFVADTFGNQVRAVDAHGVVRHVAGSATAAFGFTGDGPAATAGLASPYGLARGVGVTYVADTLDNRVRAITGGTITTVAGTGAAGFSGDGSGATALLNGPRGLAVDSAGGLLIADTGNNLVRRYDPGSRTVSTVAGTGAAGASGDGGPATAAGLSRPAAVAVDPNDGTLYIADTGNNRVRAVRGGVIETIAGTGVAGLSPDGTRAAGAMLNAPFAVAVASQGQVVIGDTGNSRVRVVANGLIATLAGTGAPSFSAGLDQLAGPAGAGELGPAAALPSLLCHPAAPGLFILDTFSHSLRLRCSADGPAVVDVLGDGHRGTSRDGPARPPGAPPAELSYPMGMAMEANGVLVADTFNDAVREVTVSAGAVTVRTVAGTGAAGFSGDGGQATLARLDHPGGVAVDRAGDVYIADTYNDRVRRVDATTGIITTVAGNGVSGSGGDGGPATSAGLFFPEGVAVDGGSPAVVYIADTFSHRIRRVDGAGSIATIAGTGQEGFRDGPATAAAQLDRPWALSVDATPGPVGPVVYVADELNHRLRVVAVGAGTVSTLAGTGSPGLLGDPGPSGATEMNGPRGVAAMDSAGTVLVADSFNDRVSLIAAAGP